MDAPWVPVAFTPRLHNQAEATPKGAKMAPRNVSPVSSGGHLSQGIIQGE